jgi:hypothetical protein
VSPTLLRLRNLLILWAFFMFVASLLLSEDINEIRFKPIQNATVWTNAQPAGELVEGFHLTQPIELRNDHVHDEEVRAHLCVRVLFATYLNRRNRGVVSLRLMNQHKIAEQRLDVSGLDDNAWRRVCFPEMEFADVGRGGLVLEIRGLDSRPGQGVTAWVSDIKSGPRASIMDQPSSQTLVYEVELQVDKMHYYYNAWVLVAFATALLALIVQWVAPDPVRPSRPPRAAAD